MSTLSGKSSRATHQGQPHQKTTSISANVVMMGQINMTFGDLEDVTNLLASAEISADSQTPMRELTSHETALIHEFADAVHGLQ